MEQPWESSVIVAGDSDDSDASSETTEQSTLPTLATLVQTNGELREMLHQTTARAIRAETSGCALAAVTCLGLMAAATWLLVAPPEQCAAAAGDVATVVVRVLADGALRIAG